MCIDLNTPFDFSGDLYSHQRWIPNYTRTIYFRTKSPRSDLDAGGINPALIGTLIITTIASIIAIPVGVGGGIYLAEYSKGGAFSRFIRFGVNVLAGVPSIIAGVFIYALIVSTKILFGSMYSGLAGGMALSILMLPIVIKTLTKV